MADRLAEIVIALRELWISNVSSYEVDFSLRDKPDACIREYVNDCLRSLEPYASGSPTRGLAISAAGADLVDIFLRVQEAITRKNRARDPWGHWTSSDYKQYEDGIQEDRDQLRPLLEKRIVQIALSINQLAFLCRELLANPIMVPSGQEKPRVRVRYITHPQRSYQDVQNELAVQLANLPRFTAYASIQGEQHRLRLNPPAEGEIDEQRIERIRQASKAWFGRPPEAPAAPPVVPKGPAGGPAGPSIARGHLR